MISILPFGKLQNDFGNIKKPERDESKVFVRIFDDTEDVIEELTEDINKLKQIFLQKEYADESL